MKNKLLYLIAILILFGCGNNEPDPDKTIITGSAVATRENDGTIVTREPTQKDLNSLNSFRMKYKEIDKIYPGPEIPSTPILYRISSIRDNGEFVLDDGTVIRLEGVNCVDKVVIKYFQRMFSDEYDRLVYVSSRKENDGIITAYVWHASLSLMKDPELKGFVTDPSYTSLNEATIMSGWCKPKRSTMHKYYERYTAIAKIAP